MRLQVSVAAVLSGIASFSACADIVVPMTLVDENGMGASVGQVTISNPALGRV